MYDKLPPEYESVEQGEWRQNATLVSDELDSGSDRLLKRIQLFVARFGFSEAAVRKKIEVDLMFAAHFAKEPRRTGLHERLAASWIENLPMVKKFKILPKGGKGAVYVTSDGNIHHGELKNRPGKSLDFVWKTGETTCYAMHKYTKEGGGNQDSQYKEMLAILKNFQSCNDSSCALFTIVDGAYYRGGKMAELRNKTRTHPPKSYALPIEELPSILRQL